MRKMNVFVASFALPALMLAGASQSLAKGTAQGAGATGGAGKACKSVKVNRQEGSTNVFDVARQVLDNGDCICYVLTGKQGSQTLSVEQAIAALLDSRDCADAPLARIDTAAGGGGLGTLTYVGGGLLIAGGAAAAAAGGSGSP